MNSLSHEQRSAIQTKIIKQLCRVSDKTVRGIENGRTDPRLSIIERMLNMGGLGLVAAPKINYVRSANPLENT